MSGKSQPKRSRHKIEPITLEELADTPGMSGICSFLTTIPATEPPLPHLRQGYAHQIEPDGTSGTPDFPAALGTEGSPPPGGDPPTVAKAHPAVAPQPGGVPPDTVALGLGLILPTVGGSPPVGLRPAVGVSPPAGDIQGFS